MRSITSFPLVNGLHRCDAALKERIKNVRSPLVGLRFHDLRHHAITELAESQVSDQAIMAIAGHVSQKILARYSHVRTEARRRAVSSLSARPAARRISGGKEPSYDTNNDTKQTERGEKVSEVIEKYGRPVRARTADLHRVKVAL
jgi:hypothetical protein